MSLWAEDWVALEPGPSFKSGITDPGTDPSAGPLFCAHFNQAWKPLILGSLLQLCQPLSWAISDPAALEDVLGRATKLLDMFGEAGLCEVIEVGVVSGTIASRTPYLDIDVVFTKTHASTPTVVTGSLTDKLVVTVSAITETGCTLRLAFDTEVVADTAVLANWLAYSD